MPRAAEQWHHIINSAYIQTAIPDRLLYDLTAFRIHSCVPATVSLNTVIGAHQNPASASQFMVAAVHLALFDILMCDNLAIILLTFTVLCGDTRAPITTGIDIESFLHRSTPQ
jgi:hypothetical protein